MTGEEHAGTEPREAEPGGAAGAEIRCQHICTNAGFDSWDSESRGTKFSGFVLFVVVLYALFASWS